MNGGEPSLVLMALNDLLLVTRNPLRRVLRFRADHDLVVDKIDPLGLLLQGWFVTQRQVNQTESEEDNNQGGGSSSIE